MRKEFALPEQDIAFLDTLGVDWEAITDQNMNWVIVRGFPVCTGYTVEKTDIAINISTGYPRSQLDMVYFFPALLRADGKPINALATQHIEGRQYQRWSRHRTPQHPWREGVDDISTHFELIKSWVEKEPLR